MAKAGRPRTWVPIAPARRSRKGRVSWRGACLVIQRLLLPGLLFLPGLMLPGCSLEVDHSDVIGPDDLETPAGLEARRLGAFGDFALAYGGFTGQVAMSGLFADEFATASPNSDWRAVDAREATEDNSVAADLFAELQLARGTAEAALEAFVTSNAVEDADRRIGEMALLAGYSYLLLAETFCSGVPVSDLEPDGAVRFGPPLGTEDLYGRALERLEESRARSDAAGDGTIADAARVGLGRVLLGLGRFEEAAAVVDPVSTDFEYAIRYSDNSQRQSNWIYLLNVPFEGVSAVDLEGGNGLDYLSAFKAGDPRTPWAPDPDGTGAEEDAASHHHQLRYRGPADPIPLATGIEARLVEAEAALQAGDVDGFQILHDALRARLGSAAVGAVDVGSLTPAERVDFHFRERGLWMWLTGHRLGDLRRLVRQYGRDPERTYPTGPHPLASGGRYGAAVVLPVPDTERRNPMFTGCLDLDA